MSTNLKDRINRDILIAFKGGDNSTVSALRFLMSVIKNTELLKRTKLSKDGKPAEELEKLSELTDEETVSVVLGEIKKRKESVAQYEACGREDLAKKETLELEILKKYAPEEMPEAELRDLVKKKISDLDGATMNPVRNPISNGVKDFGKIMGSIMAEVRGRAGGDAVKKIIEEELKNEA